MSCHMVHRPSYLSQVKQNWADHVFDVLFLLYLSLSGHMGGFRAGDIWKGAKGVAAPQPFCHR